MNETLLLARHGETAWNKKQRLQGSHDLPLATSGRKQAKELAESLTKFSIDRIFASDLKRAYQTAEIVGKKLKVSTEKEEGFNERFYGTLEGKTWPNIQKELLETNSSIDDFAEQFSEFSSRVLSAFADILKSNQDKNSLIICHGGVLRVLLEHLRKTPPQPGNIGYELPNASIYLFSKIGKRWIESDIR